jgi:MarR family 2-MHQ and catechol resistance regulon transcriptional repressor
MTTTPGYDLIIRLLETSGILVQESRRLFRPHGLTEAQFNVLNVLGPAPAGLSQRELSDVLVVDRSNTTVMLERMEKSGWVRRADHPDDRRIFLVTLTPAGRKLWQKVLAEYVVAVDEVTGVLNKTEIRRMMEKLDQLGRSARQWGDKHEA